MLEGSAFFVLVFLGLAIFMVYSAVKIVPQGYEWTVERFGRYTHTLEPGFHIITPVADRIGRRIAMQETVMEVPRQEVITRDNAMVQTDGVLFFQIVDAASAAYAVKNMMSSLINLAQTNIRNVIGSLDLDEVLSNRDQINEKLLKVVDKATNPWGIKITRIEIRDLSPPADITTAMAKQMKAERERRAEILQAEGEKQAAILRAEGLKQSAILEAEGRKEAAFRDAEARERSAEAEAKATEVVSAAIADGNVQAINYFLGLKYVEAYGKIATAPNQRVVILPAETTQILGSLSGIAELAKAAFAPDTPHKILKPETVQKNTIKNDADKPVKDKENPWIA
ncbi:MAG: SPFH domain-containing protein [Alphaproteobacteria bacterium]